MCSSIRKLEFSHSPSADESEFEIVRMMLGQCKLTLNRFRIDNFKTMEAIVEIGLNSFIRLRKLRIEHLDSESMTSSDLHCLVYRRFLD